MSLYLQVLPKVCHMGPGEIRDLSDQLCEVLDIMTHDALKPLAEDIGKTIDELERHYDAAVKEDKIAERNHEHDLREDRPNA